MKIDEFKGITNQAVNVIFDNVLPRFFKKYGVGESLPARMLDDLNRGCVYETAQEVRMGEGGFIRQWRDNRCISFAKAIKQNVPVDVKEEDELKTFMAVRGLDYGGNVQALVNCLHATRQEEMYQELKRETGFSRLASFRNESHDVVYEFSIDHRQSRRIDVYYPCWCALDKWTRGLLFKEAKGLEKSIGLVLFHELIHCMESVPDFPTPLSDNEQTNYENVLRQIFKNMEYTGNEANPEKEKEQS